MASMAEKPVASVTAVMAPLKSLSIFYSFQARLVNGGTHDSNDGGANGVSAAEKS
jgi:hypothetical protein